MLPLALFLVFEPYTLTISLFERALALHNLIAFASFYSQWRGLIGSKGISPARDVMQRVQERGWTWKTRWRDMPTLLWIRSDDRFIEWVQIVGMAASIAAFLGVFSGVSILIAAVCYSSIKSVGGVFTGLQMHAHMMEIDLIYVACSPFIHVAPSALVVLAGLLNFRVMFGGGAGKWFGSDESWKNGTAMSFHYWTQPLPNPLSAWMHRRPMLMHYMETYATFVHESFCALFVFAPWWLRIIPFVGFESLMLIINLTGNYAQIGAHTMNESILLLNDDLWNWIFECGAWFPPTMLLRQWLLFATGPSYFDLAFRAADKWSSPWNLYLALIPWMCFVLPYALVQLIPLSGTFHGQNPLTLFDYFTPKPMEWYCAWIQSAFYQQHVKKPWQKLWEGMMRVYVVARDFDLFGSYVKFGHMTKFRWEIIIEGSVDGHHWLEYEFKYKPSRVNKTPPFVPFHLPAMDWRLWFLPLEAARGGEPPAWFMRILVRLLECEPTVMALFDFCPFSAASSPKPQFMRALLYDYRFRYKYEEEEALKTLVRKFKIPDTNIVTQSDAEDEAVSEGEEEDIEDEENEVEQESPSPPHSPNAIDAEPEYIEHEDEEDEPSEAPAPDTAAPPPSTKEGEGEKDAESKQAKKPAVQRQGEQAASSASAAASSSSSSHSGHLRKRDAAEELLDRLSSHRSKKQQPGSPNKDAHHSHGLKADADAAFRRALLARQRALIRQLLRGAEQRPRKPLRKLAHEVPPEFDENCERVWWVRRHLIGPYGPILAVKPKPLATDRPQEPWEQAMEPEEEE